MKMFDYTEIVINLKREYVTQQGLHMNEAGKERMAKMIESNVQKILHPPWNGNEKTEMHQIT